MGSMKIWLRGLPALLACATAWGQQDYAEVPWPLPAWTMAGTPSLWHFGEVAGVTTIAAGNLLVLHRGANPILEFDVEGRFVGA